MSQGTGTPAVHASDSEEAPSRRRVSPGPSENFRFQARQKKKLGLKPKKKLGLKKGTLLRVRLNFLTI
jgi:hypothetical protein